jgi:hypothetical protein
MTEVGESGPTRRTFAGRIRGALPILVLALAVIYSLYLQTLVKDGVFFNGDAGPKALMTKQFAAGRFQFDLELPGEAWVQDLWAKGWYPFAPPFVYEISGRRYIEYPLLFPALSAPFHALSGFRGLYAIPLFSMWALWALFLRVCRRLRLSDAATALALGTLCMATPLTPYSAMFWEHVPAVFLAFVGIACFLRLAGDPGPSHAEQVWAGALLGVSVILRSELFCIIGALTLIAGLTRLVRGRGPIEAVRHWRYFLSTATVVVVYFASNALIYGHPLGAHAFQVVQQGFSLHSRLRNAWVVLGKLSSNLVDTFPLIYFMAIYAVLLTTRRRSRELSPAEFVVAIGCLYAVTVPLVLPDISLYGDGGKQWGPRYLLILMPIVSLAGPLGLQQLYRTGRNFSKDLIVAVYLALFAWSVQRNSIDGSQTLAMDYSGRVLPVREFLRANPEANVAVEYQHMAQELLPSLPEKNFFLVDIGEQLERFSADLAGAGRHHFYYLRYASQGIPASLVIRKGNTEFQMWTRDVGRYGIYALYEVDIVPR